MQRVIALIVAMAFGEATGAGAQTQPDSARTPPTAKGAEEIVVQADRAAVAVAIDRKVYVIGKDLQSVTGSVSDVLHDLPSVEVGADGSISLRGDPNVQILIDGKPSTSVSAANRGEALQALPADRVDRIEVITNPSARFKPDGSAGIINIITKRPSASGWSGTLLVSGGSDGRYNLATTHAYNHGRLAVTGGLTLRRDLPFREFGDLRRQLDPAGGTTTILQPGYIKGDRLSRIVDIAVDYDLTPADRLGVSGNYNTRSSTPGFASINQVIAGNGTVLTDFTRRADGHELAVYSTAEAKYRHGFAGKGHMLTLDVQRSESIETQRRRFVNIFKVPAGLPTGDQQMPRTDDLSYEATVEYTRPLPHGAKLLLGYDFQRDDDSFDNRALTFDPATDVETPAPGLTNNFTYGQTVHAGYATLDAALGKRLAAVFGLRVEATTTDVVLAASRFPDRYLRVYPTLHLERTLSDAASLQLSYSHRIVRPQPYDLDPYPLFNNPLNLRSGNPFLKPQETDAVEAGYHYGIKGLSVDVTPYVRNSTNVFSDFVQQIGPNLLLLTRANLGRNLAAGSELAVNGKAGRRLSYSFSGNLYYNRVDAANLGVAGTRALVSLSAKASADWKLTARDTAQISVNYVGRRLVPQGYRLPNAGVNLGFRHQLRPGLSAVLTITDVFDSQKDRLVVDIGDVRDESFRRRAPRVANFALNWAFGGKKAAEAKFDYTAD